MNKPIRYMVCLGMIVFFHLAVQAQTTGSIAGMVLDQSGAFVSNATVVVRGQGGQEFTVSSGESGTCRFLEIVGVSNCFIALTDG